MTMWAFPGDDEYLDAVVDNDILGSYTSFDVQVGDSAVVFSEKNNTVSGLFRIQTTDEISTTNPFTDEYPSLFQVESPDVVFQAEIENPVFCEDLSNGGHVDNMVERAIKKRLSKSEQEFSPANEQSVNTDNRSEKGTNLSLKDISKSSNSIDARKQDFSGEKHGRLRLDGAKLRGADLSHTDLAAGPQSDGTTFTGAELQDVNFRGAKLNGADFTGAQLNRADFTGADLSGATLSGNLTECEFSGATMNQTNLSDATVAGAEFVGVQMRKADFRGTQLTGTRFDRVDMQEILTGSGDNFKRLSLNNCNLNETDIAGVDLRGSVFKDCDLVDANLTKPNLDDVSFLRSNLTKVEFSHQSIEGVEFSNSNLSESEFKDVVLKNARFTGARMNDAKFRGADVSGAVMANVKASEADFTEANIERVAFSEAELFGARFVGASMYGAILQSARIGSDTQFHTKPNDSNNRYVVYDDRSEHTPHAGVVSKPDSIEKAMSVYQTLEAIMEQNAYSAAARCYFLNRKEMERVNHSRLNNWRGLVVNNVYKFSCGYGESFKKLFGWASLLVLSLGAIYPYLGLSHDQYGKLTYADVGILEAFGHGLQFSLSAFTGLGYGSFEVGRIGETISTFETAGGVLFFALLVFVLTRRVTR